MSKTSRKKVGKPTGETTKSGRPVYIDDDTGERRSEFSRTIKLKNGKYINIPSIHNGMYYKEKELKKAVEDNRMIPTSEHDSLEEAIEAAKKRSKGLNKGGAMEKQMEMQFGETPISQLAEGGMSDDGGEKDPVSGNDVPVGSMAEEVRDDVPAMVSEGEFIFPADVTRFIGLNKLMELRQDAKMGLKKMEAMGQLGNPEDAELPDDIPFDMADIIIMDDEAAMDEEDMQADEMNMGGLLGFNTGTADPASGYYDIQKEANKQYARRYVYYKNEATGETRKILADFRGNALEPIPAGFKVMLNEDGLPMTVLPKKEEEGDKAPEVKPQQGQQKDDNDTRDPMDIIKQGRESAKITADRLGMDIDEYINLPIKTRFNLLSEELNVMRGGTLDIEKRDAILAGAEGDSIFGGSLIGGIFDMIGSVFDKDNDGSMWTSTDKDGNVRNIFGQIIQTDVDVSKMGILKDGRWTGATTKKKLKNKSSSGNLNQKLNDTSTKSVKSQSIKDDLSSSSFNPVSRAIAGARSTSGVGKGSYNPVTRSIAQKREDNESRRQDRQNQGNAAYGTRAGPQTGKKTVSGSANQNTQKQKNEDKENLSKAYGGGGDGNMASGKFGNKGMLIEKPPTKKKPTKGKTLVTKKS